MALNLEDKKAIVVEVRDVASRAVSAIAANYRGLTVSQMTALRAKARETGVYVRIVRNTLARRAFQETDYACMTDALVGPLVLFFSETEPSAAARLVRDFTKTEEKLDVTAIALNGELIGADKLGAIASLPSKDEAIASLMSVMKAPVEKLVRTMAEPYAMSVRVMAAIKNTKN